MVDQQRLVKAFTRGIFTWQETHLNLLKIGLNEAEIVKLIGTEQEYLAALPTPAK